MRCEATTAKGRRCKAQAMHGHKLCGAHRGAFGRKSKLTDGVQERVVTAIRAGNYKEISARSAGIGERTLYRWLEIGEADYEAEKDTAYAQFWQAVKKAEAEAEVYAVATVRKAMPDDWKAAMTFLERTQPARWGRKERFEVKAEVTHVEQSEFDQQVAELLEQMKANTNGNARTRSTT